MLQGVSLLHVGTGFAKLPKRELHEDRVDEAEDGVKPADTHPYSLCQYGRKRGDDPLILPHVCGGSLEAYNAFMRSFGIYSGVLEVLEHPSAA